MQVQAPPPNAPPAGSADSAGLFDAFYQATAPVAFDFASGLTPRPDDVAAIVSSAYENVAEAHLSSGAPYHAVPLLAEVYRSSAAYPPPPLAATRPGVGAVAALGEPHRSILHLMERLRFSAENTGAIIGLDTREVTEGHEDARAVAHGVSAALALCPGGVPSCPTLAAELGPGHGVVAQTERILAHAERCELCLQIALTSPDPIRELRLLQSVRMPPSTPFPPAVPAPAQAAAAPVDLLGGAALGAAAGAVAGAPVWSPAPAAPTPLPGPAPAQGIASKAPAKTGRTWAQAPLRLWNKATGWQKSGAIMAVLLVAALVVAIVAGGESEDVAARTNGSTPTPQGTGAPGKAPIPTIPPTSSTTTTTGPITTTSGTGEAPTTSTYTGSGSASSGSHSSGSSGGSTSNSPSGSAQPPPPAPSTTAPPPQTTVPPTTAPPPAMTSYSWGAPTNRQQIGSTWVRDVDFQFASTGTSVTYTTSWGAAGNLLAGEGTLALKAVPVGFQSIMVTVVGPGGAATVTYPTPLL